MSRRSGRPVLMIALEPVEPSLLYTWMRQGRLQHLARLTEQGIYGRLRSSADWLTGTPWPSFASGVGPAEHGLYSFVQWRPQLMAMRRPAPKWLPIQPFWRTLSRSSLRSIVIDVPLVYPPDETFDGIEVFRWANHDRVAVPGVHPVAMRRSVVRRFGPPSRNDDLSAPQPTSVLLRFRDRMMRETRYLRDLALDLIRRERWDLLLVSSGATHLGGHRLWDGSGMLGEPEPDKRAVCEHALLDLYAASDAAVGRLVDAAGRRATVLVFAVHGMGCDSTRNPVLPGMLTRVLTATSGDPSSGQAPRTALGKLWSAVPVEWRNALKRRMPWAIQGRLTAYWRLGGLDWRSTQAFYLISEPESCIRVNLKGRERDGLVAPGTAYRALCARIADGLRTFRDADSGEPVIESIRHIDEILPSGAARDSFPDPVVRWVSTPGHQHRALSSPEFGTVLWPTPGLNPDGRSGNHRPKNFLIGVGETITPDTRLTGAHVLDLAPTVYRLLGVAPLPHLHGRILPEICGGSGQAGTAVHA